MTQAKLKTALPDGSGLTGDLIDTHYAELIGGKPSSRVVAIVVMIPVEQQQKVQQNKNRVRSVTYQIGHIEPFDGDGEATLRDMLSQAIADRTGVQPMLFDPGPSPEDEAERAALLEDLLDWSERSAIDLVQRWYEHYDRQFVPAPEKASLVSLRDFMVDKSIPFKAATPPSADSPAMAGADIGPGAAGDPFAVPEPTLDEDDA